MVKKYADDTFTLFTASVAEDKLINLSLYDVKEMFIKAFHVKYIIYYLLLYTILVIWVSLAIISLFTLDFIYWLYVSYNN